MSNKYSRREVLAASLGVGAVGCAADTGFRVIDPHVHVWVNDAKYPWPEENTNPPAEDALAETLLELMETNGVAHTVIVHPMHYRWDCRYVGDVMKRYPDKFQGVCRVNPEAADAADELRKWTEEWGFKGVRLSPSVNEGEIGSGMTR